MADEAQLMILREGVEIWNRWRKENPEVEVDLNEADLRGANLSGANLDKARLRNANLGRTNLNWALLRQTALSMSDLSDASLVLADLTGAILRRTKFVNADLTSANLTATKLWGTDLRGANLSWAIINGADPSGGGLESGPILSGAVMSRTLLANVNLSTMLGLQDVRHDGPSTIGVDTIYRSKGEIPEVFLRGVGVPDEFFTYVRSLVAIPIEYYSCFISYSHEDEEFAQRLHADLQTKGVRCWFAPHDVQGGRKLHEQIDQAIRVHERVLLILSLHSMNSEWVKTEIAKARKQEIEQNKHVLFPLRLVSFDTIRDWECFDADAGKDSAREIREYFIPDFSHWKNHDEYQKAFGRLMKDLKAGDKGSD
jgi:hypothetical protein